MATNVVNPIYIHIGNKKNRRAPIIVIVPCIHRDMDINRDISRTPTPVIIDTLPNIV
jgi:hypothetical protein